MPSVSRILTELATLQLIYYFERLDALVETSGNSRGDWKSSHELGSWSMSQKLNVHVDLMASEIQNFCKQSDSPIIRPLYISHKETAIQTCAPLPAVCTGEIFAIERLHDLSGAVLPTRLAQVRLHVLR